jgi:hypothetical protein
MHITLRKAAALQLTLNEVARKITLTDTVSISQYQDHQVVLDAAVSDLRASVSRRLGINNAVYEIRKLVSDANHRAGIDALLCDLARVTQGIGIYEGLVAHGVQEEDAVIAGKLNKLRSAPADSRSALYGMNTESVDVHVTPRETHDNFRAQLATLKREKQRLQDRLLELNVSTTINLPKEVVAILETEQLV